MSVFAEKNSFSFDDLFGDLYGQPSSSPRTYRAPERPDSLTDIFNSFAADALRDYPKLQGSFMFIDGKTGEAIGDVTSGKLEGDTQDIAMYFAKENYGGYADTMKLDAETNPLVNEGELYAIRYNKFMGFSGNDKQDLMFTLEHELGHAVVPEAIGFKTNYCEEAGDVFAMMKHIQRYGDDDGTYITLLARKRTEGLLDGDIHHFTNPALSRFAAVRGTLDIPSMSPEKMTEIAAAIADESQFTGPRMRAISTVMKRAHASYEEAVYRTGRQGLGTFLMCVVSEIMQPDVYKAEFDMGLEILKPFMRDIPGAPSPLPLDHQGWPRIAKALAEKERTVQDKPRQQERYNTLPRAFPHVEQPQPPAYREPPRYRRYGGGGGFSW